MARKSNTPPQLSQTRQQLLQLVTQAGQMLRTGLRRTHQVVYKGEIDIMTEMDQKVETFFIRTLTRVFPGHEILSEEESAARAGGHPRQPAAPGIMRWIIDPLDGTTNYAHGFPHFGVSAGVEYNRRIILGAVYNPMLDELFFAELGKGAWKNGKRIKVSRQGVLRRSLLATGFPYDLGTSPVNNFAEFERLSRQCQAVRRAGAASLDLCDVACGRFDGFWEYKLKPWDVAAAALLIQEAGGKITNQAGKGLDLYGGTFIASNGRLHSHLLRLLREAGRERMPRPQAAAGAPIRRNEG